MTQEEILNEILELYREIEGRQEEINMWVKRNKEEIAKDTDFEEDYSDSINSYELT